MREGEVKPKGRQQQLTVAFLRELSTKCKSSSLFADCLVDSGAEDEPRASYIPRRCYIPSSCFLNSNPGNLRVARDEAIPREKWALTVRHLLSQSSKLCRGGEWWPCGRLSEGKLQPALDSQSLVTRRPCASLPPLSTPHSALANRRACHSESLHLLPPSGHTSMLDCAWCSW